MQLLVRKPVSDAKGNSIPYSAREVAIPLGTAKNRRSLEDINDDIAFVAQVLDEVDRQVG
jgi:hypothetical protein